MKSLIDYSSKFRILKGGKVSLVVSAMLSSATLSFASPTEGTISSGSVTISQNGSITNINQSTSKASINWQSFNIGVNETVNFNQPSSSSITLNRVTGASNSLIQGVMNANGQVFLINPNGVLFSQGSQVNVSGLIATTKNLSDSDFNNDNFVFDGNSQQSIVNKGTINANNGYVALLGQSVSNEGTILATLGTVELAGGKRFLLNTNGNSLVNLTIDEPTLNSLVENKGLIKADGGKVHLTTKAINSILDGMVNNTGIIEAQTLSQNEKGEIVLFAHGGTANIDGTLDASFVETSGDKVKIEETTQVVTNGGEWFIDPVDFTIATTGGDIMGTTLSSNLRSGSVTIQSTTGSTGTNGDINLNDSVTWTSGHTLSLEAQGDININESIDASGGSGGKLVLEYGKAGSLTADYNVAVGKTISLQSGQNFDTKLGSNGTINWEVITSLGNAGDENSAGSSGTYTLQNLANSTNLTGNFVLGSDINASSTSTWNNGAGFIPIGNSSNAYTKSFDGLGHTISDLIISKDGNAGLFGSVDFDSGSSIKNLNLKNIDITSTSDYNGGLIGELKGNNQTSILDIKNVHVTGNSSIKSADTDDYYFGGLIGSADGVEIENVSSSASVSYGQEWVGGLIGEFRNSILTRGYATGTVTEENSGTYQGIGGLIAESTNSDIIESYATGDVIAPNSNDVGGLIGKFKVSAESTYYIKKSYSTGDVTGQNYVAGLLGNVDASVEIEDSYTTGNVIGQNYVAGFMGYNKYSSAEVTRSYAANQVTGTGANVAGFVAYGTSRQDITDSFWDIELSGLSVGAISTGWGNDTGHPGILGKTSIQMKEFSLYGGGDAQNPIPWNILGDMNRDKSYPTLRWAENLNDYIWVIGLNTPSNSTTIPPTQTSSTTIPPTQTSTQKDYITSIVNNTIVRNKTPNLKQSIKNIETISTKRVESSILSNNGSLEVLNEVIKAEYPEISNSRVTIVGDVGGEEKITTINMEQLLEKTGGGELRVALSPDSFVELVNGGVSLPNGVSQEFYVVEDER